MPKVGYWVLDWEAGRGAGIATHSSSGVRFNVSRAGWVGMIDDAEVIAKLRAEHGEQGCERFLRQLLSEVCLLTGVKEEAGPALFPDQRTLH